MYAPTAEIVVSAVDARRQPCDGPAGSTGWLQMPQRGSDRRSTRRKHVGQSQWPRAVQPTHLGGKTVSSNRRVAPCHHIPAMARVYHICRQGAVGRGTPYLCLLAGVHLWTRRYT